MRKLNKQNLVMLNTVEAYLANCFCPCECIGNCYYCSCNDTGISARMKDGITDGNGTSKSNNIDGLPYL